MNETIPDKEAYQTNRRRMCWAALSMMIACTAATIYDPARMSDADSTLMAQYLALPGLVGAYFALGIKEVNTRLSYLVLCTAQSFLSPYEQWNPGLFLLVCSVQRLRQFSTLPF